jgi:hypothetical protein
MTAYMYSHTTFVHKVTRLIYYLGLGKCWAIPGKGVLNVPFTGSISELYGQRVYILLCVREVWLPESRMNNNPKKFYFLPLS